MTPHSSKTAGIFAVFQIVKSVNAFLLVNDGPVLLIDMVQGGRKASFEQRLAELSGKQAAVGRFHVLIGNENRVTMEVVAIFLGLSIGLPGFKILVLDGIVVDRKEQIGVLLVRFGGALGKANLVSLRINHKATSKA